MVVVLLVEETGVLGESRWPLASQWQANIVSTIRIKFSQRQLKCIDNRTIPVQTGTKN
jgi:hypothetical protein